MQFFLCILEPRKSLNHKPDPLMIKKKTKKKEMSNSSLFPEWGIYIKC